MIDQSDITQCPRCQNRFQVTAESQKRESPVLIMLDDFQYWHNNTNMISRKKGQLETDPNLVLSMINGRLPVAVANPSEWAQCKCGHVFALTHCLGDSLKTQQLQQSVSAHVAPQPVAANADSVRTPLLPPPPTPDPLKQSHGHIDVLGQRLDARFWEP